MPPYKHCLAGCNLGFLVASVPIKNGTPARRLIRCLSQSSWVHKWLWNAPEVNSGNADPSTDPNFNFPRSALPAWALATPCAFSQGSGGLLSSSQSSPIAGRAETHLPAPRAPPSRCRLNETLTDALEPDLENKMWTRVFVCVH